MGLHKEFGIPYIYWRGSVNEIESRSGSVVEEPVLSQYNDNSYLLTNHSMFWLEGADAQTQTRAHRRRECTAKDFVREDCCS